MKPVFAPLNMRPPVIRRPRSTPCISRPADNAEDGSPAAAADRITTRALSTPRASRLAGCRQTRLVARRCVEVLEFVDRSYQRLLQLVQFAGEDFQHRIVVCVFARGVRSEERRVGK